MTIMNTEELDIAAHEFILSNRMSASRLTLHKLRTY